MIQQREKICPQCGSTKMKTWAELTDEQKMLAESLAASAEYPLNKRKKHRFCTRCWFESNDEMSTITA